MPTTYTSGATVTVIDSRDLQHGQEGIVVDRPCDWTHKHRDAVWVQIDGFRVPYDAEQLYPGRLTDAVFPVHFTYPELLALATNNWGVMTRLPEAMHELVMGVSNEEASDTALDRIAAALVLAQKRLDA